MANMTKKQKATTELTDEILTWDESFKQRLDPYLAAKLAEHLVNKGYHRKIAGKSHYITYKGKTKRLSDWAREYGLLCHTLYTRLKHGWSIEEALTTPVNNQRRKRACTAVIQCNRKGVEIKRFDSIKEAAASIDRAPYSIMQCCQGKIKTIGGYVWKYAEVVR